MKKSSMKRWKPGNLLLGLSTLEIELLLDRTFGQTEETRDASNLAQGNLLNNMLAAYASARGKIPAENHLEAPQILAEKAREGYSVRYNPETDERIEGKLRQYRKECQSPVHFAEREFLDRFEKARRWIIAQQLRIAEYLCQSQNKYVKSADPLDLKPIRQRDVAAEFGYATSTVSRLARYFSIQLPDKRIIFAQELMPGVKDTQKRVTCTLRELQVPPLYDGGVWKVTDTELRWILQKSYGIGIARRTVTKYTGILEAEVRN